MEGHEFHKNVKMTEVDSELLVLNENNARVVFVFPIRGFNEMKQDAVNTKAQPPSLRHHLGPIIPGWIKLGQMKTNKCWWNTTFIYVLITGEDAVQSSSPPPSLLHLPLSFAVCHIGLISIFNLLPPPHVATMTDCADMMEYFLSSLWINLCMDPHTHTHTH